VGADELGEYCEEEGADNSQVRIIPIQLQILFARLLLLNQQSCRVDGLINSFGWTNNEEMQQHDVQELNRILFAAIESSLVGTSGEHLIGRLYRGTAVQQVLNHLLCVVFVPEDNTSAMLSILGEQERPDW
jgi:ubiquitin carboxyl-terminal hydrolase 40